MYATTDHTLTRQKTADAPPARLALKAIDTPRGLLDGAWWPRSRDLTHELIALADVLDPLWGRITRIAVNPRRWPVIPRKVAVNGHVVKVGWFDEEMDPHKILLRSYTSGRWDLLVIPPETGAAVAARLMAAVTDDGAEPLTASALLTAEGSHQDTPAADRLAHGHATAA